MMLKSPAVHQEARGRRCYGLCARVVWRPASSLIFACLSYVAGQVRLALMSRDHLGSTVMSSELMKNNAECSQMVMDIMHNKDHLTSPALVMRDSIARPRLPNAIMLAIGGWSGADPTNYIEAYDFRADLWIDLTNSQERPRAYHGTAFLNGYVYCVGGLDRQESFNSVRRLDLSTRTWQEVGPMHYRRRYVSTTVLNGCIYAMGGYDGHVRHDSGDTK